MSDSDYKKFLTVFIFFFALLFIINIALCFANEREIAITNDETRTKVALLDTGVNPNGIEKFICKNPILDLTNTNHHDSLGHGTHLANLISAYMNHKKQCILIIKVTSNGKGSISNYGKGIERAIELNSYIINISAGGPTFSLWEKDLLIKALNHGIIVNVSAGNESKDFSKTSCNYYPACYALTNPNFYVVGSLCRDKKIAYFSNRNGPVDLYEPGCNIKVSNSILSGTSVSTAIWTGKLLQSIK